jgi:hypothetical protein
MCNPALSMEFTIFEGDTIDFRERIMDACHRDTVVVISLSRWLVKPWEVVPLDATRKTWHMPVRDQDARLSISPDGAFVSSNISNSRTSNQSSYHWEIKLPKAVSLWALYSWEVIPSDAARKPRCVPVRDQESNSDLSMDSCHLWADIVRYNSEKSVCAGERPSIQ